MANEYLASILSKGQSILTAKNASAEKRVINPSIMSLALRNTDIAVPNPAELRTHEKRPVEINYFKKRASGAATAKSALHTGSRGDTAVMSLQYTTHVETFSVNFKSGDNNVFPYQAQFNDLYEQAWASLRTRHNESALARLIASRTQLASYSNEILVSGAGTWNSGLGALEISDDKRFIEKAKAFMKARYFYGMYDIVAQTSIADQAAYLFNQGAGNNVNTNYQFGDMNLISCESVISSDYTGGSLIIMPTGTLFGLNWNDKLNKSGINEGQTETGIFTVQADPFGSGAKADVSMYVKRADTSTDTAGGSTQDLTLQVEVTLTIAYGCPPLTTANDGVPVLAGLTA